MGFSCTEACGILVLWPAFESTSPALKGRFLTTGPPGKSLVKYFIECSWTWVCLIFSHEWSGVMNKREWRRQCPFCHITSGAHDINTTYYWWFNLDCLIKVMSVSFFYCKVISPPPPFHSLFFEIDSVYPAHTQERGVPKNIWTYAKITKAMFGGDSLRLGKYLCFS